TRMLRHQLGEAIHRLPELLRGELARSFAAVQVATGELRIRSAEGEGRCPGERELSGCGCNPQQGGGSEQQDQEEDRTAGSRKLRGSSGGRVETLSALVPDPRSTIHASSVA